MKYCDGCKMIIWFWQHSVDGNHWCCLQTRMNMFDRLKIFQTFQQSGENPVEELARSYVLEEK
jgi:hypothetical protein